MHVDEASWHRSSFEGRPTSGKDGRRTLLLACEQISKPMSRRQMPVRVPLDATGALAFLMRRRFTRMLRTAMEPHGITVHPERWFNPRWVELRRDEQTRN